MLPDDEKVTAKVAVRPRSLRISARVYRAAEGKWVDLGVIARTNSSILERIKKIFGIR